MDGAVLDTEGRIDPRTNMFIAAAIQLDGVPTSVKVRNLSTGGALIETSGTAAEGASFILLRGSLMVRGTVVWSTNHRCGLRFESTVNVRDWMAPPVNPGQINVDAMITQVRSSGLELVPVPLTKTDSLTSPQFERLAQVSVLIEALEDELAADLDIVSRHGVALQKIDQALQLLAKVRQSLS